MDTVKQNLDEIIITCTEGVSHRKNKLITVRISAPKEAFMLSEALSRFEKLQSIEEFFINGSRVLLTDYLAKAEQILSSAPPLPITLKTN